MADSATAARYAQALIEIGVEDTLVDRFAMELETFARLLNDPESLLLQTLSHPGFSMDERRAALDAVMQRLNPNPMLANFLRLVLEKDRAALLPQIISAYHRQADKLAGRVRALVTTAQPLDKGMRAEVQASLERATGKIVLLEEQVDASIIGGVIAEVEGRVFDASLRTRLLNLRQRLLDASAVAEA
ncbi:MAG: ATP synthase F1 subunit delta [Alphaproteobacteria bacterium]|nr:ATP synthase F1 subunit delta [Alphaproteobacteria bacterium]